MTPIAQPIPIADKTPIPAPRFSPVVEGAFFVFLATIMFSLSLPMTRFASPQFGGWVVGLGRIVIAGAIGALVLLVRRERFPARQYWPGLLIVIMGVILGFPILASLALQTVPASHGAVTTGIIPIGTAIWGAFRARERPPMLFWVSCAFAVVTVILFAISEGAGGLLPEDLLLFAGVIVASFGYVEGGRLARTMDGWRVIAWGVAITAPFVLPFWLLALQGHDLSRVTAQGWVGFLYVSVFSQFIGFFAMYRGLAVGGISRVSMIQLLQPFLTLVWAGVLVGESIKPTTIAVALLVVGNIAFSQWVWARERSRARAADQAADRAAGEAEAEPLAIAVAE